MIVFAHLGHWYSAFGFLVPAALVILWTRFQARRERRLQEFAEDWTMELRDGDWRIVSVAPAPPPRRRRRSAPQMVAPPWPPMASEPRRAAESSSVAPHSPNGNGRGAVDRRNP